MAIPPRAPTGRIESGPFNHAPVLLAKANQIAVGGFHRLYLLGLDEKGKFKTERQQMVIANQSVEALAYSERFDWIYVGVEKRK